MNRLALCLPLALSLAACAPVAVRTGDARLVAVARTPEGVFNFDCNPALNARQNGVTLRLSDENSFACPSLDGRATLALSVYTVTSTPAPTFSPAPVRQVPGTPVRPPPRPVAPMQTRKTEAQVLLVVAGAAGNAPVTYSGRAAWSSFGQTNFPWSRALRGEFSAELGGGASVTGNFNLRGE